MVKKQKLTPTFACYTICLELSTCACSEVVALPKRRKAIDKVLFKDAVFMSEFRTG